MHNYITNVGKMLVTRNIKFEEVVLTAKVHSVNDVADICKCKPNQVVKSLLYIGNYNPILVILNGNKRANKLLIESFTSQKIRMATPSEVTAITSFQIGDVAPFQIDERKDILSISDILLCDNEKLFMGSGMANVLISMTTAEFKKAYKGIYAKIT